MNDTHNARQLGKMAILLANGEEPDAMTDLVMALATIIGFIKSESPDGFDARRAARLTAASIKKIAGTLTNDKVLVDEGTAEMDAIIATPAVFGEPEDARPAH